MKNKIFLTSALAMGVIAPAMAEPQRVDTFPNAANNEFMQENKVYTNAATEANMAGVYEDGATVDAVAEYTDILYNIVAGNYLKAGSDATNGTTCPAGSWCPGLTDATYNETADQGINSCPSGYASSAAGSSSDTQCYRACDINNMGTNGSIANIAHAATLTGNDYYGNGADTCEPATCVAGWHRKAGLNLSTTIGNGAGENRAYVDNAGTFNESNYDGEGAKGVAYYGLSTSNHNTWAVDYGSNGMLVGQGRCSTQPGVFDFNSGTNEFNQPITTVSSLTDETGQEGALYCYCNVTGYTPASGTLQSVSSSWVFKAGLSYASECASHCADHCADVMRYDGAYNLAFRGALLGSVGASLASCEANVININWSNADAEDVSANNAGTTTYGSDVRTPVKAQTKKGKTFRGWRFSKPQQTNLP